MRLIRGAPGSGKTAQVFREFKAALGQGDRAARIIVPTATLVRHFQHELARDGVVFPPSSVISLSRFVAERAPAASLAPDGLLRAIVRDALRRLDLPEFVEVSGTAGMTATILDTIGLFENAGCTPEKLAGVRKLSAHGKAFEKVWRAVDQAVRECGFATRAGMIRAAAANREPLQIWMDGFIYFSPLESELVSALARTCDVTLTLTDTPAADDMRKLALRLGATDKLLPGGARKAGVTAVAATSMPREADEIARRILDLHDRGTAFREIGVALRDAGTYLPLLRGTFERFGVPARYYFAAPLRKHPAALFLGGLISCALSGWEFGAALDTLRAHPLWATSWGDSAAFDRFDFTVREAMPGRGADALLALCEDDVRKRIGDCLAVDAWRNDRLQPAAWQHRFEQLAQSLYRPGMLEVPRDHAGVESARSHVAAVRAWVDAVASAAAFWVDGTEQIALGEFWHVATEAVEGASIHVPDERRDVVHVMSVYEARQWDVGTLFVCGVTDRDYPRKNAQNLLFSDGEIEALHKSGIQVRKAADLDREEVELFASLRSRARDSLVLTYPEHDAAGKSASSSRYLAEVEPVEAQDTKPMTAPHRNAGRAGRVESPGLLTALSAHHQRISLTSLEDLAQCRFKFFAGRTLGLKARPERPEERLQPKVTGLILHQALEAWLNVNRAGEFVAQFETAFDNMCREKHLPAGYKLEVERMNYREIALRIRATEQWTPVSTQVEVDLTLDYPGGITVTGRVDRIDHLNDRDCIIVDYKSSKTANVEKLVKSEVKLQGPLYALAVRENLNLNTIAMMYVAVREDKRFGWGAVPGANLGLEPMKPNWMADARDRSIERLADFLSGAIKPAPADPDQCKWCDYKQSCRVEQEQFVTIGARGA